MGILDRMTEEAFAIIYKKRIDNKSVDVVGKFDEFPSYMRFDYRKIFESLEFNNLIKDKALDIDGWRLTLTPEGESYFVGKKRTNFRRDQEQTGSIKGTLANFTVGTIHADGGNVIIGDVVESNINVDNSTKQIREMIERKGGVDKEELNALLDEAIDFINNIKETKQVPESKSFMKKVGEHVNKNSWFYAAVVQLMGKAVLEIL